MSNQLDLTSLMKFYHDLRNLRMKTIQTVPNRIQIVPMLKKTYLSSMLKQQEMYMEQSC